MSKALKGNKWLTGFFWFGVSVWVIVLVIGCFVVVDKVQHPIDSDIRQYSSINSDDLFYAKTNLGSYWGGDEVKSSYQGKVWNSYSYLYGQQTAYISYDETDWTKMWGYEVLTLTEDDKGCYIIVRILQVDGSLPFFSDTFSETRCGNLNIVRPIY